MHEGYWWTKPHINWTKAYNHRFRLLRIDAGPNHVGKFSGAQWDDEKKVWIETCFIDGEWLKRRAKPDEIPPAARGHIQAVLPL